MIKKIINVPQPFLAVFPPLWLLGFALLVGADLASKKVITDNLRFHLSYSQVVQNQPIAPEMEEFLLNRTEKIDLLGEDGRFIKFRLVFNDRFAFSLGPSNSLLGFFISFFAIIFLLFYRLHNPELGPRWAWLLIFSGAFGNLIDKMFVKSIVNGEWVLSLVPVHGHVSGVVDFIECIWFGVNQWSAIPVLSVFSWESWPTFNIADSCVTVGIGLLLIYMLRGEASVAAENKA